MALYAFDGTWNEDEEDEARDSNVVRFRDAYQGHIYYLEGVGTRLGFIGKVLGGVAGAGGRLRIREAIEAVERHFAAGDRMIDIVGFSRGSALAVHFANEVKENFPDVRIRFLGIWDLVASFGIPGNPINIGWHLTLPDNVEKCCHALALDERRENFRPTRIKRADGSVPPLETLREVWFRGVHSDVGGGQSVGLSHISLCWMIRQAEAAGLSFDAQKLASYASRCDATAPISKNFDPQLDPARRIKATDLIHHTVSARPDAGRLVHNNPPPGNPIETA